MCVDLKPDGVLPQRTTLALGEYVRVTSNRGCFGEKGENPMFFITIMLHAIWPGRGEKKGTLA